MKQKEPLTMWPSLADLMTILAVPSLCISVGLFAGTPASSDRPGGLRTMSGGSGSAVILNDDMFGAIQEVERYVLGWRIRQRRAVRDQTMQFALGFVSFGRNETSGHWQKGSLRKVQKICSVLTTILEQHSDRLKGHAFADFVTVEVEGHADSTTCSGDPECNWWYSSGRAAWFIREIRKPGLCPGTDRWFFRTAGLGATKPIGSPEQNRRIVLRIVPDYRRMIRALHLQGRGGTAMEHN